MSRAKKVIEEVVPRRRVHYQYAVKVVCGKVDACGRQRDIVEAGHYLTAINIHNPSHSVTAPLRWKVAVALPALTPGPISAFSSARLRPDEAAEIDCPDVMRASSHASGLLKGFVVIESPYELDVVAVYTASRGCGVDSLALERVPPRAFEPCADLRLSLRTGSAKWTIDAGSTVGTTAGPPAIIVAQPHPAWLKPQGASWVSVSSVANGSAPVGRTCYGFRFCLCSGAEDPKLALQLLADDEAEVFLNGQQIPTQPSPTFTGPVAAVLATTPSAHFVTGENLVTVCVENSGGGPTGFWLKGTMTARQGRCPVTGPILPDGPSTGESGLEGEEIGDL